MSCFLECPELVQIGVAHGFGLLGSDQVEIDGLQRVRQVHGTHLVEAPCDVPTEADALFTRQPGAAVGLQTADCVPLLLADTGGRGVAAVHAGWRGSAAGISGLTVARLGDALGIVPAELVVAIGPHIGPCCYEVDQPVRDAVADSSVLRAGRPGHWQLDLFELNRRQLEAAGVAPERVHRVGECTGCHPDRYPSFRRDRTGRRMLHWIRQPD